MGFGGKGKWGGGSWGGGGGGGGIGQVLQSLFGGGGGYGGGYGGGGKGWGKDKGKGKGKGKGSQFKINPNKKVWIGGLPAGGEHSDRDLNKALQEHCKQAGECKFVSIGKTGTGSAAFSTEEEAAAAIAVLNGTTFQGHTLEVDTWTKKDGSGYEKQ